MNCNECKLPIEYGDYFMEVYQRTKSVLGEHKVFIHVQCITKTQGRTLKRQEKA